MPIYERPLFGLLRITVSDPLKANISKFDNFSINGGGFQVPTNERDIFAPVLSFSTSRGSTQNGPSLNADVGTFTIELKDEAQTGLGESVKFYANQVVRFYTQTPQYNADGSPKSFFLGIISNVTASLAFDENYEEVRTIVLTGTDLVQKLANTAVNEIITGSSERLQLVQRQPETGEWTPYMLLPDAAYPLAEGDELPIGQPTFKAWLKTQAAAGRPRNPKRPESWYATFPALVAERSNDYRIDVVFTNEDVVNPSSETVDKRVLRILQQATDPSLPKPGGITGAGEVVPGQIIHTL